MLENYKIHCVPRTERFRPGYGRRAYRIISDLTKNRGISSRVGHFQKSRGRVENGVATWYIYIYIYVRIYRDVVTECVVVVNSFPYCNVDIYKAYCIVLNEL